MGWGGDIPWCREVKFCRHVAPSSSPARQNNGPVRKTLLVKGGHDGQAKIELSSVPWRGREAENSSCFPGSFRALS